MGNYATVSEVRSFVVDGCLVDLSAYDDVRIGLDIDLAESFIEGVTNDIFYSKTETNLFDGNGLTRLFYMPLIAYPIIASTSITEVDIDGTTVLDTFVKDDDFKEYPHYIETAKTFAGDTARRRFGTGGKWPKGQKNISIVGTWGRATTPNEIARATILLTLESLVPGSVGMRPAGIHEAAWDDFRIKVIEGKSGDFQSGELTGYQEVDILVRDHMNWVDMFNVVPDEKQTFDNTLVID